MPSPLGRPVRVGVFEHDPDAFRCFRVLPKKNCPKPGAEMEIVQMVMDLLGWDWEVVDTESAFGVMNDFGNQQEDGNFSGIMGLLAEDKVDMSGLSMRITPERMEVAHFTFPIRYFQQVYIISRPPEDDFRNFIFATFTPRIWLLLFVTIIGVALFRFIVSIFMLNTSGHRLYMLGTSIMEVYGVVLRQKIPPVQVLSSMILEGTLVIIMVVVYTYYQSSMNSKLTAPTKAAVPFYQQSQLIDLLETKQRYLTYYFNFSLEGSTRSNERRIKKVMKYNPIVTHPQEASLVKEIKKGGVFYSTYDIEFLPHIVSSWDRKQGLTVIRDKTGIVSYVGFGFSKHNKRLCNLFNKALLNVLPGVGRITLAPNYAIMKDPEDKSVQAKKTSLSLTRHLEQLFEMYLIGMAVCICTFFLELAVIQIHKKRKRREYTVSEEPKPKYVTVISSMLSLNVTPTESTCGNK